MLNSNKCSFGKKKLTVLGHLVDQHATYSDRQKTAAITKFPIPENVADVRSVLGLCSYYRRLHDLLKKRCNNLMGNSAKGMFLNCQGVTDQRPCFGTFPSKRRNEDTLRL
ncbi:hypothetical protein AVEN_110121-1 [Araneus ventricosus]|uniref:Retrovirus-related Pol polyprotein from transposon opus n=1 Tax=Araneus ventricosus TaxID=182803 RepID=A0A4Y2J245_ARAVE|nr:hypothetical protein AVEN_110121-1 [Araneus ventricosus]